MAKGQLRLLLGQAAQAQGYAESDPTLDVNGWDAAHKAIILASLSYGFWIKPEDTFVQGIEQMQHAPTRAIKAHPLTLLRLAYGLN